MNPALTRHIDQASESVRAANHAALGPVTGPDAYAVVGGLAELVHRLPQLLDYLGRGLRRAEPAQHYDDRGADPAGALCRAHGHLAEARGLVDDLAGHLDHAHNQLGHLGRVLTEED
ncbi:hypothetical protein [Actinomycetospora straminea]|uniref:Excreted virulence factor EspC (Type VII ESX diderm) n=1 Tax=Actinomycetospora straminea TaxID=663607 RepID=A0ABP9EEY8_9PSEU|nr:hypothetical protein [Actinomycetospora straminea]MDD7934339.1 hypothetical protein [Actinomycetospora straminea]